MAESHAAEDPPPSAPIAPQAGDCCQSGCDLCVFQLYEEERERYEKALREWESRRDSLGERPKGGAAR